MASSQPDQTPVLPSIEETFERVVQLRTLRLLGNGPEKGISMAKMGGFWLSMHVPVLYHTYYNFKVNSNDVVLAGFPKSGNNWLRYIIRLLITGDLDSPRSPVDQALVMLEVPVPLVSETIQAFEKLPSPKVIPTHLPPHLLPESVTSNKNIKIVYCKRNPRDVAVSYWYHYQNQMGAYMGDDEPFEDFAEHFIDGEVCYGPWHSHVNAYTSLESTRGPNTVLVVDYEELKSDPSREIRRIAEFLGITNLDDATVNRIVEKSKFESMSKNDDLNWSANGKAAFWNPDASFMRKGQVGDWRNHFKSDDLLKRFDDATTGKLGNGENVQSRKLRQMVDG